MDQKNGKLTKQDLEAALRALEPGDRHEIQRMAQKLDGKMKVRGYKRGQKVMFGKLSALELLAKVGIFINNYGKPIK